MKTTTPHTQNLEIDFRRWLQAELTDRCRKNPRYSLRSFAAYLEMDASSVSQILAGKRQVSTKVIERVCERLSAHPDQKASFLKKISRTRSDKTTSVVDEARLLEMDAFAVISDWYHFAILELTFVDGFTAKPAWIARALGITPSEAQIAIERLLRLELLRQEGRHLMRTQGLLSNFRPGMTSAAHKNLQKQILAKALDAVDNCPQDDKDITSITVAVAPSQLPEARKRIAKFRRELAAFLEDGEQTRVYHFGLQLYPVSNPIKNQEKKS